MDLTYCTNVHPTQTLAEVREALRRFTRPIARASQESPAPFPVGLYLSAEAAAALEAPEAADEFRAELAGMGLSVVTLNAFPYGGFHRQELKSEVFRPTWMEEARARYTRVAARVLARLAPAGQTLSISTVAGSFKQWGDAAGQRARMAHQLACVAQELEHLEAETGREMVLSLEPEPFSTLETTAEVVKFFEEELWSARARQHLPAASEAATRRHLGVCYDTCHQAVEFESMVGGLQTLERAGVRIGKMQLSSALRLPRPAQHPEAMEALARFAEPRYLHQTFVRKDDGSLRSFLDLPEFLECPEAELRDVDEVRVHFHVPIDREQLGPLGTTRAELREAARHARAAKLTRTFEVETYTFSVLPGEAEQDLVAAIGSELRSAREDLLAGR